MSSFISSGLKFSIVAICMLVAFAGNGQPQHQKVGYADWDYIFGAMPEFKDIDTQLQAHGDQLQAQIVEKTNEIEGKLKAFQALPATTDELIRNNQQQELQR